MKRILLTMTTFLVFLINSYSYEIIKDDKTKTYTVIATYEEWNAVVKKVEVYDKISKLYSDLDSSYTLSLKAINEANEVILSKETQINSLVDLNNKKDALIEEFKKQIRDYENSNLILQESNKNLLLQIEKYKEIDNNNNKINRRNKIKILSLSVSNAIIGGLFIFSIVK